MFMRDELTAKLRELRQLKDQLGRLEEHAKKVSRQIHVLETSTIPEMMITAGVTSVTIGTYQVEPKPFVRAHITEENRKEAHAWLRKNGHGDIIKRNVVCKFPAGSNTEELEKKSKEMGVTPTVSESVHYQTMNAWVRNYEDTSESTTNPIPENLFGIFRGTKLNVKETKND